MAKQILDTIDSIRNLHQDRRGVLVGSGPSLDVTNMEDYSRDIIFAMGQSITAIDRCDYFCFSDGSTIEASFWERAKSISVKCIGFGKDFLGFVEDEIMVLPRTGQSTKFDPLDQTLLWGVDVSHPTVHLAYLMGIRDLTIIGVDYRYAEDGRKYCHPFKQPGKVTWGRNQANADARDRDGGIFGRGYDMWKCILRDNKDIKIYPHELSALKNLLD